MGQKEKQARGKFLAKHETEENWNKSSYVPAQGEHVVYDPDADNPTPRVKYGDGINVVKDLPFATGLKGEEIANAVKGKISGNPIRIDDSSPISHEVKIEGVGVALVSEREVIGGNPVANKKYTITAISSEQSGEYVNSLSAGEDGNAELDGDVANVGGVFAVGIAVGDTVFYNGTTFLKGGGAVTKYGKNLCDPSTERINAYIRTKADGTSELAGASDSWSFAVPCSPNTTYTVSHTNEKNKIFRIGYVKVQKEDFPKYDGVIVECFAAQLRTTEKELSIKTGEGATYIVFQLGASTAENAIKVTQCEVGAFATEFEPYKEPETYTADENGKAQGITANGKAMTLIAENGTTIMAEYNKDTNKVIESLVNAIISLGGNV